MDKSIYLFAAFGISWTIISIYVFKLFRNQQALDSQIDKIIKTLQQN